MSEMEFTNIEDEYEEDTITLTLEDGTEMVCGVIASFPVSGKQYIALTPLEGEDEGQVYLYQIIEDGEDIQLINIEDDDEFEAVSDAFDEILDNEEFDELFVEEDEEE